MIHKKLSIAFVWKTPFLTLVLDILNANDHDSQLRSFMSNG
jgi:hypothetical protein